MAGFVGFAILEIGGVEIGGAGLIIIEALVPERFEIKKMSGVFLDRPFVAAPARKSFARQPADGIGQPFRRFPEPFQ